MPSATSFWPYAEPTPSAESALTPVAIDPRLSRTSYYDGRLLRATDLTRDQQYIDNRLRELGRVLGGGVTHGLALKLSDKRLVLAAGGGFCRSGRALEVREELRVSLTDRASIASLNEGTRGHFSDGLYVVALEYVERTSGVAEIFPSDLAARATPQADSVQEGVRLALVRLEVGLPRVPEVQARAQLAPRLCAYDPPDLPYDALALGVLAFEKDEPIWLDATFCRMTIEDGRKSSLGALLARQYEALFDDIRSYRLSVRLAELDWAASDYLSVLPAVGPVPKASILPQLGTQAFFPPECVVHVTPVREDEWESLRAEALLLPPIELASKAPNDILIVARLDDEDFARLAFPLSDTHGPNRAPINDPLALRYEYKLSPTGPDTGEPASPWSAIWEAVESHRVWYVRRSSRAASNLVIAELARGLARPDAPPDPPPSTTSSLGWTDLEAMLRMRVPALQGEAANRVLEAATEDASADLQRAVSHAVIRLDPRYDPALWPTLDVLRADPLTIVPFASAIAGIAHDATPEAKRAAITAALMAAGIRDAALAQRWSELAGAAP